EIVTENIAAVQILEGSESRRNVLNFSTRLAKTIVMNIGIAYSPKLNSPASNILKSVLVKRCADHIFCPYSAETIVQKTMVEISTDGVTFSFRDVCRTYTTRPTYT